MSTYSNVWQYNGAVSQKRTIADRHKRVLIPDADPYFCYVLYILIRVVDVYNGTLACDRDVVADPDMTVADNVDKLLDIRVVSNF